MGLWLSWVVAWAVGLPGGWTPNLTRQKVKYSCMTRFYCVDKARTRLGYAPRWGVEEGVRRTVKWFRERDSSNGPEKKGQ